MKACTKCLENNWRFAFDDAARIVTATCRNCEAEVSFAAKPRNNRSIDPKRLKPVSLAHRYVPDGGPIDRPNKLPWED